MTKKVQINIREVENGFHVEYMVGRDGDSEAVFLTLEKMLTGIEKYTRGVYEKVEV